MKIFWLLFLLADGSYEGPVGIYTEKSLCIKEAQEIQVAVKRKTICEPAVESVLRYYAGETLGDTEWSKKIARKEIRKCERS